MRGVVGGSAVGSLVGIAHVAGITVKACAAVCQHLFKSLLRSVRRHLTSVYRGVELYLYAVHTACILHISLVVTIVMVGILHAIAAVYEDGLVVDNALPVVILGGCTGGCHVITLYIIAARIVGERIVAAVGRVGERNLCHPRGVLRAGTGLEIVVHHIYIAAAGTAVAAVAVAPVVNHAVAEVHALCLNGVGIDSLVITVPVVARAVETRGAVVHVGNEVMVERSGLSAPDAAVAVVALVVAGVKSLGKHTPLHCEIPVVVERRQLVDAPRH